MLHKKKDPHENGQDDKTLKTQDEDGAESRMLDEYDYEYIDDDDATLELEDVAERLKRFVGSLNHDHHDMHYYQIPPTNHLQDHPAQVC